MTDAPERIWAFYAPYIEEDNPGCTIVAGDGPMHGAAPYIRARVVPASEDAADDARIAAASRREWAERAWRAEAERDRLLEELARVCDEQCGLCKATDDFSINKYRAALKGESDG